jgi:hydroxymethylpyrimidine/phosphomethylpyrimidine kinase
MHPCVLIFAGSDPSGGAGLQADIQAVTAFGVHPLTVVTALTVQDNDRVLNVHPVPAGLIQQQAHALTSKIDIAAVKIGITGNRANAEAIAGIIELLRKRNPALPVVLDPVLASGHGDALSKDDAVQAVSALLPWTTLVTPNMPEAVVLCGGDRRLDTQAERLLQSCPNVLIKGGHGDGPNATNHWFSRTEHASWAKPRLAGTFHGTGCTLASSIAALLAQGKSMRAAIETAGEYCHAALESSYAIAEGQRIPNRSVTLKESA